MKSSNYNLLKKCLTHTYSKIKIYVLALIYEFWIIMQVFEEVILSSDNSDIMLYVIGLNDEDRTLEYSYTSQDLPYLSCSHNQWALHWEWK